MAGNQQEARTKRCGDSYEKHRPRSPNPAGSCQERAGAPRSYCHADKCRESARTCDELHEAREGAAGLPGFDDGAQLQY